MKTPCHCSVFPSILKSLSSTSKSKLGAAVLGISFAALASPSAKGQSSTNLFFSGAPTASGNTWSTGSSNWATMSGGTYNQSWQGSSSVPVTPVFEGAATTVTIVGTSSSSPMPGVAGITFTTDGYTLQGGFLQLTSPTITTMGAPIRSRRSSPVRLAWPRRAPAPWT